jgi:hypothetical protein
VARTLPTTVLCAALALSLFSVSLSQRARAQDSDVAIDALVPPPDQAGFTGFPSTRTPGHLGADGTLWLGYGLRPFSARGPDVLTHRLDATLALQLGILSRGAIALRLPFAMMQRGEVGSNVGFQSGAVGNPALDGRIRVFGAPVKPDGSVKDGAALAVRGVVHLPVGTSGAFYADDAWRTELSAIADIELFGIGGGISFGYRHRYADGQPDDAMFAHMLRLSAGLRLPLPLISRALPGRVQEAALIEIDVGTPARDFFAKQKTPVEGRLGYRLVFGDLFGTLSFGAGFTDVAGVPDFRMLAGFGWSPRQHDQDADGVPDRSDQCVHLPEDRDGFQDEDGCADDDNDGDLIVDEDDRCPLEAADPDRDDDEDGCTDD